MRGLVLAALLAAGSAHAGEGPFLSDPKAALRQAGQDGRPLLLAFHTSWCEACERMNRTTWRNHAVTELLGRFVALSVDGERSRNLVFRYDVKAFPTIIVAEPGGEPVLVLLGFQGAGAMRDHLARVLESWDELSGWAVEASARRPDPAALIGLGDFARSRSAHLHAERCYRRALRDKSISTDLSRQARLGLAEVLAATDRCREATKVLKKAGVAETPSCNNGVRP